MERASVTEPEETRARERSEASRVWRVQPAGGARGFLVRALTRSHSFSPSASHTIFVDNSSRVAAALFVRTNPERLVRRVHTPAARRARRRRPRHTVRRSHPRSSHVRPRGGLPRHTGQPPPRAGPQGQSPTARGAPRPPGYDLTRMARTQRDETRETTGDGTRTPLTRREATAKHYLFRRGPRGPGGQPRGTAARRSHSRAGQPLAFYAVRARCPDHGWRRLCGSLARRF